MLHRLPALLALAALAAPIAFAAERPNVIVIMADDLGYGDISSNGATTIKTPNIDRLAAEGLRFTSGYCSASTCTPTRYSFLTGSCRPMRSRSPTWPKPPATKPPSSANGTSASEPKAKVPIGTA